MLALTHRRRNMSPCHRETPPAPHHPTPVLLHYTCPRHIGRTVASSVLKDTSFMPNFQVVSTRVAPTSIVDAHSQGKMAKLLFLNQQVIIKLLFLDQRDIISSQEYEIVFFKREHLRPAHHQPYPGLSSPMWPASIAAHRSTLPWTSPTDVIAIG